MKNDIREIKQGIKVHLIKNNKFKTNLLAVFLTIPIEKENATANALIPAVLRRGTQSMKTLDEISKNLENMYGASFNCGIEKTGDNQVIKFYLEVVNDEFLPEKEKLLQEAVNKLMEIIFAPLIENGVFSAEYVKTEKEKLKQIIEGKIDNKAQYAMDRCIEIMYENKPFGIYKYGYVEDLEKINEVSLFNQYKKLINECKIDIFVSGDLDEGVFDIINKNEQLSNLNSREAKYIINDGKISQNEEISEKIAEERMDISQGKLILGLNVLSQEENAKYVSSLYNAILGGTPTSKLFQNVREKASLAYTASSSYVKPKNSIFIKCGIECENYEKALEIIRQQIEDLKNGKFTDEEFDSAKKNVLASVKFIPDEQDTEITYYLGQELSGSNVDFEEYAKKIVAISKDEVKKIGETIKINTIYFLKSGE